MNKIPYKTRREIYLRAEQVNGLGKQLAVAIEELSEVQKEICKLVRDKGDLDHLAEEIADATIVLEQLRLFFVIGDEVDKQMDAKLLRLAGDLGIRLEEEDEADGEDRF